MPGGAPPGMKRERWCAKLMSGRFGESEVGVLVGAASPRRSVTGIPRGTTNCCNPSGKARRGESVMGGIRPGRREGWDGRCLFALLWVGCAQADRRRLSDRVGG